MRSKDGVIGRRVWYNQRGACRSGVGLPRNWDANAILVTKQASGSAKIDPLMAAFNAIALMPTNPWSARPSIFVI